MPINQWPGTERPREKLLAGTAAELSDAEVLAVVLQNGTANKSALALGRELLAQYGSIKGVLRHSRELPSAVKGVGPATVEVGGEQRNSALLRRCREPVHTEHQISHARRDAVDSAVRERIQLQLCLAALLREPLVRYLSRLPGKITGVDRKVRAGEVAYH